MHMAPKMHMIASLTNECVHVASAVEPQLAYLQLLPLIEKKCMYMKMVRDIARMKSGRNQEKMLAQAQNCKLINSSIAS